MENTFHGMEPENIRQSSAFLNTVLENLHSSVFVLSRNREIKNYNQTGIALLNKDEKATINRLFGNALDCMYTDNGTISCGFSEHCHRCPLLNAINQIFSQNTDALKNIYDTKYIHRGEQTFTKYFYYSVKAVSYQGERMALLIVDDVTEREKQKQRLNRQNQEIYSSIRYAERIQNAMLPDDSVLKENLSPYFLFYKPQQIIGGDFYWTQRLDQTTLISVADCTGHGIPGALITMLGITALNDIVKGRQVVQPHFILNELRSQIIEELNSSAEQNQQDGMDISICAIHPREKKLYFAGANSRIILVHQGEPLEIKGNNMPVGAFVDSRDFTLHQIDYHPGDMLYMFSDGYQDQFGGPYHKKFGKKQFRQMLHEIHQQGLQNQKNFITQRFEQWKGNHEQIDDVTLIGMQLN